MGAREGDLRRAHAVLGLVAAARHARRVGVDQEQGDAVAVRPGARDARADDQLVGAVAVQDEALVAVNAPEVAVRACAGLHMGQIVAGVALAVGEGQAQLARADGGDQFGALLGIGRVADQAAGQDHRGEIGLDHQGLAEGLHDDHGLDLPQAQAAVFFGEGQHQQAHLGELAPHGGGPAVGLGPVSLALFEGVLARQQLGDAVLQHRLIVGQIEVHTQSPKKALAMMVFWISLDPP